MPNTKDTELETYKRILVAGRTGTGKSTLAWTLPGRKFAYIFDPNALSALKGLDMEYELFLPDIESVDSTLKGFNKGARDDRPTKRKEPTLYNRWGEDINKRFDKGFFDNLDWLVIDSLTFLSKAVMDRQLYINNRYGGVEELADYKVVGSKMAELFGPITSLPLNVFCTAHLQVYQDDRTSKVETQLYLPGRARIMLPLQFTDIFLSHTEDVKDNKKGEPSTKYLIRTKPDARGLQDIRTSIPGLDVHEDVTIHDFTNPTKYGLGKILAREEKRLKGVEKFVETVTAFGKE
jgi:hypothetical protein